MPPPFPQVLAALLVVLAVLLWRSGGAGGASGPPRPPHMEGDIATADEGGGGDDGGSAVPADPYSALKQNYDAVVQFTTTVRAGVWVFFGCVCVGVCVWGGGGVCVGGRCGAGGPLLCAEAELRRSGAVYNHGKSWGVILCVLCVCVVVYVCGGLGGGGCGGAG